MKIAVEGCAHGELDRIYDAIRHLEQENNIKVDLLLCCGDFQSVRNFNDLNCLACPPKYRQISTFYQYYSGEKVAPVLTIFIGGNHEASNYLQELAYGGWVAPKIYYLGYAGVISVAGIRIGGLSGIYKGGDFLKGHYERPPYNESSIRSAYHIRNLEVFRLKQISKPMDIFMTHDWPKGVYHHGNKDALYRKKPFFRDEMEGNLLGSRPAQEIMEKLKPSYWFSAHLHVKFSALVKHADGQKQTKFLALDKCLPRRDYLQIIEVPHDSEKQAEIEYDPEWLHILKRTNHLLNVKNINNYMPGPGSEEYRDSEITDEQLAEISAILGGDLRVPSNFQITATPYKAQISELKACTNPQTTEFCQKLGIFDPMAEVIANNPPKVTSRTTPSDPSEFELTIAECSSQTFLDDTEILDLSQASCKTDIDSSVANESSSANPDEISLQDDNDDDDESMPKWVIDKSPMNIDDGPTPPKLSKPVFKRRNKAMYENTGDN